MSTTALRTCECCAWCRQPVSRCSASACDSTPTYSGILLRGQWVEVPTREDAATSAWPCRGTVRPELLGHEGPSVEPSAAAV